MALQTILEQHAGQVLDRQHVLAEKLGPHEWSADLESGLFFFSGPNFESSFEILGTVSQSTGEWLWAWANASLPGELARIAHGLHDVGKSENIETFTRDRFPAKKEELHSIGIAACGLGGAKAYYIAEYDGGTLLVALTGEYIMRDWQSDHLRIFTVFPRLLQQFDLHHKTALTNYLTSLGYAVRDTGDLYAERDGKTVAASFDAQGRLTDLRSA